MRENYKKDEASVQIPRSQILKRILAYFTDYKARIAIVISLVCLSTLIVTMIPLFTEHAVDVDIANKDKAGLIRTVALGVSLIVLWWGLVITKQHLMTKLTNEVVYRIREDVYKNIITLPLFFFDSRPTGRILARLVGDMNGLKQISTQLVDTLIPNVLMLLVILVIMTAMNPVLSLSAFIVLPILVFFAYVIIIKGYKNWESFRKKNSNYKAFIHEDYAGIRAIKSFNAEDETSSEAKSIWASITKAWIRAVGRGDLLNIVIQSSQGLGYFFLFFFAIEKLSMGEESLGEILAYIGYMGLFWQPIRSLASMYNQMTNNFSAAARVFELMDEKSNIKESSDAIDLKADFGRVTFDDVSFAYPDEPDRLIIKDISFDIEGGKRIALVGPTGAGKTTIINLIARFYDTVEGRVLIDGFDVRDVSIRSLRDVVTVMPQDSVLFTGTIRDNLKYGKDVSDEDMRKACRRLGIEKLIESLESGYDTEIKNTTLSQGQKQLIALARTLIAEPKILILDEATSSVDTRTELLVQEGLKVLMENRTTFVVAHRLSTIKNSDEIFVINNQRIVERGNHKELMALGGEYKALYDAQFAALSE